MDAFNLLDPIVEDEFNTDFRTYEDVLALLHLQERHQHEERAVFDLMCPVDVHQGPLFVDVLNEYTMWAKLIAHETNRLWLALNGVRIPEWEERQPEPDLF